MSGGQGTMSCWPLSKKSHADSCSILAPASSFFFKLSSKKSFTYSCRGKL